MLTNNEIRQIALQQSAWEFGCMAADFLGNENKVLPSANDPRARKYLVLPTECAMVSYGSSVVAQCSERVQAAVQDFVKTCDPAHFLDAEELFSLQSLLDPYNLKVSFMAEYFLPDVENLPDLSCPYEMRLLHQKDFSPLYLPQWSNALCEKRKQLDVLGVAAYDRGEMIGFAACSADAEEMYQIGIDVLPGYRRQGVASALTARLTKEILALGKAPFYCAAWCNLPSVKNALRCGYRPAWVEMGTKEKKRV